MFQLNQMMMTFIVIVLILLDELLVRASDYCAQSVDICQNGVQIDYPFYNSEGYGDNTPNCYCGYPGLLMNCAENDPQGRPEMNISDHLFFVQNIDSNSRTIRLVDNDIDGKQCPRPRRNVSFQSNPSYNYNYNSHLIFFYNCSSHPRDVVQNLPCLDQNHNTTTTKRSFVFFEFDIPQGFNWFGNCEETVVVPTAVGRMSTISVALTSGFDVQWSTPTQCQNCKRAGGWCAFSATSGSTPFCDCEAGMFSSTCPGLPIGIKIIIGSSAGLVGILLIIFIAYQWRSKTKSPTIVEAFLENYGGHVLQKYKYSIVKKMTNSFKDRLGQGGYGSVFKGKLPDGRLVAVKILNGSKGNGEEFINEVATIGGTNHVNVVSLLGFCAEGTKRALIYEFMPNGSLERFIYNNVEVSTLSTPSLGWDKLYQIALGISKGLEYLHCHCNTRILHFDIKPHNILLNQDFCPKISDFGLAKLCLTSESVISMVGARGTIGYIAPEVYCRNFGGVSHKSDVYSYGMMVLEMIGGRKNINATVENSSEIYFPQWIYNHLNGDRTVGVKDMQTKGSGEKFEDEMAKKMITVALWCIQTRPRDRPSISNVVEMLEGNIRELQMPPNPFEDPPSRFPTPSP